MPLQPNLVVAAATPTYLDYIKALSGFAAPVTASLCLIGLIFLVAAIAFRWFEVNVSLGKLVVKIQRPTRTDDIPQTQRLAVEGIAEDPLLPAPFPEVPSQAGPLVPAGTDDLRSSSTDYFQARSVEALDKAFLAFAADFINGEDNEFWQTDYLARRARYGADGGREAVRQLAKGPPHLGLSIRGATWVES